MDISAITTAYNGLKMAKDVFVGLADLEVETESLQKINDAARKVGEAQDTLFQLREELFRLQEENSELKKLITEKEDWKKRLVSAYEFFLTLFTITDHSLSLRIFP